MYHLDLSLFFPFFLFSQSSSLSLSLSLSLHTHTPHATHTHTCMHACLHFHPLRMMFSKMTRSTALALLIFFGLVPSLGVNYAKVEYYSNLARCTAGTPYLHYKWLINDNTSVASKTLATQGRPRKAIKSLRSGSSSTPTPLALMARWK